MRWVTNATPYNKIDALFGYMRDLDRMHPSEVNLAHFYFSTDYVIYNLDVNIYTKLLIQIVFQPYGMSMDFYGSEFRVSLFHGTLSCLDITEPYMPDRVARQFGRVQGIPQPVIEPTRAYRLGDNTRYRVEYPNTSWALRHQLPTHRIPLETMGPEVRSPWDTTVEYMEWYHIRTHPMVCPSDPWYAQQHYSKRGNYGFDYPPTQVISETSSVIYDLISLLPNILFIVTANQSDDSPSL